MPRGGHRAAVEQPTLLIEDIRTFFSAGPGIATKVRLAGSNAPGIWVGLTLRP
jgi:hypothetical protein